MIDLLCKGVQSAPTGAATDVLGSLWYPKLSQRPMWVWISALLFVRFFKLHHIMLLWELDIIHVKCLAQVLGCCYRWQRGHSWVFWGDSPNLWTKPRTAERTMATQSSTLAWKIPWTEEPGRLQSMGLRKVGYNWSNFTFRHWRRTWQPTPVFLPGESQGWWSLVGCCLWGCTESDTTERLSSSSISQGQRQV